MVGILTGSSQSTVVDVNGVGEIWIRHGASHEGVSLLILLDAKPAKGPSPGELWGCLEPE
jgi:hypothetical protein